MRQCADLYCPRSGVIFTAPIITFPDICCELADCPAKCAEWRRVQGLDGVGAPTTPIFTVLDALLYRGSDDALTS